MPVAFGEFVFDPELRELRKQGNLLKVDPKQLDLLACFVSHPGKLLSKEDLLSEVWEGRAIAESGLSVTVAKLRKVLGKAPGDRNYIENRYGRGYRFLVPVAPLGLGHPAASAPAQQVTLATASEMVGRADAMQRLDAACSRALAGSGSVCVLIGEPGIGKTRLAEAIERVARSRGAATAWGRFQTIEGAPPLWAFGRILRELNASGIADDILRVLDDKASEQPQGAERGAATLGAGDDCSFDALDANHRTVDQIAQVLCRSSQRKPLVLLLDDLQWADAASLRVLNYLIAEVARWPLCIIATQRSTNIGLETRPDLLRVLAHRNAERIELPRLREADVAEYVTTLFGTGSVDLAREVFGRCEGNPFFMVELLRPWIGVSRPEASMLQLPGVALDLVRQRLRGLAEDTRAALRGAAVIGRDFDLGLLSHVCEHSAEELLELLDDSLANDTLTHSAKIPGAYAFDHDLIREALLADVPASELCRLHLRVGEGLALRRAAGAQVSSAELAHHWLSALPQGDVSVAIGHARSAAAVATRLASHADARELLRRALDSLQFWIEPPPETLTALLLELAMVERVLADGSYVEHLARGVALAREHRYGPLLTVAGQLLSPSPGLLAQADAHSVLEAAAEIVPASEPARRATVLAHLSWTPPNCSSARRVHELLAEADQLARRSGSQDALAVLRAAKLYFSAGPATLTEAETLADEIEREQRNHPETARNGRNMSTLTLRMIIAMQRGDAPAVQRMIQARADALAKLKNAELNWHHERMLLIQRMNRGEFVGVDSELAALRERAERQRLQAWRILWWRDFGALMLWTGVGDSSAFGDKIRRGLVPSSADSPSVRARKMRSQVDAGFSEDARAAFAQISIDALRDQPGDRDYLATLTDLAAASAATGSEHSSTLYELLAPFPDYYAVGISFHSNGSVSYYLGLLAAALGRDQVAVQHYERALERNAAFGLEPWVAQTSVDLASLLLDSNQVRDRRRALALLEDARAISETLGLRPLEQAIQRRLRTDT